MLARLLVAGWNWEPSVLLGLILATSFYTYGVGPLQRRWPGATPASVWQKASFYSALVVAFFALISPLDELSDHYLLTAHMVQHLLLTLVMPPLLLLGLPEWFLRPLFRPPQLYRSLRLLTHPLVAILLFNLVFSVWHFPTFYDLTLEYEPVHILEHLLFMGTALLTWWPVLSPLPEMRLPYPAQILYLFFESLPPTILGAIITFAQDVLYAPYALAPRIIGVSVKEDQQLAGLIMWIPGSVTFLIALTVVFFLWFNLEDPDGRVGSESIV